MLSTYSAGDMLMRSLNFPCMDAPHAPLADALEVDDFLFDDVEQCYNFHIINHTNAALIGESELSSSSENEEKMEQDGIDKPTNLINDSSSESGDGQNEEEEYPELVRTCGESVVESESYDFIVMDTEKDMNSASRKRKAGTSTVFKKKRLI
uniref:Uncharacterized protein n=1 Tax=Setaria digitata TaxID=48799 RepID=A0A915PKM6_9BILA